MEPTTGKGEAVEKARINDVEIAYEVQGEGEPVLLIHGAFVADGMRPLAVQPELADYKVISYHRRGYGDSSGNPPPDVATHAADARALLEHLDATPAHVIGHSYGGSTAIQLACETPDAVRSLVLLEPGIIGQIPSAAVVEQGIAPIGEVFQSGDAERASDMFLRTVMGPDYRRMIDENVSPDAWDQTVGDALDAFGGDLQSLGTWTIGAEQTAVITCPTLFVVGEASGETVRAGFTELGVDAGEVDLFGEMIEVGRSLIPHAEVVTLPGLNHALQIDDASVVAGVVGPFLAKRRTEVVA